MGFVFLLFVITFLSMPFLALIASRYLTITKFRNALKNGLPIFLIYDTLLISGFSLQGDYPDYCMWSLQYFYVFVIILAYRKLASNILTKILGLVIYTVWIVGILITVPELLIFPMIDMDYVPDQKFAFKSYDTNYETRRFKFGFVTLLNTRYTFETYRKFDFMPFEKKIDESIFFDDNSGFDGVGDPLQMSISKVNGNETLTFKAPGRGRFDKIIR